MKIFCKYFRNRQGTVAVEFAMVAVLFMTFLFGIIEVGRVFWTWNTLQYAVETTARYAIVHQSATNSDLVTYAANRMSGISVDTSKLSVTTATTTISGISFIEVTGTYAYTSIVPFLPAAMNSINLTAKVKVPYVL
ncbi:MAG: pilus assembly protein [Alphaproteobacteria bacterium]|nr:pilus assembly protein [Alphaproteobacteria bacterium]